jgi:hypothetical protein
MAVAGGRKQRSSRQQAHVPSWDSERTISHGVKTTRPCSVPRTARARTTAAPRATRPVSAPVSASDDELRFARPQGSDSASALEDDELRLARPQGSDSASAPEDDELRLARPQGSDSASAPEDDKLRLARPQGSDSALASDDGLRLARPGAQTRPRPRKTDSTSTSEEPPPRPTQGSDRPRQRGGIITIPLASSGYGEQDRRPIWLAPVNK